MPTMSPPSHITTVPSAGISVRHADNESGGQIQPKLVAPNNDIAGQSATVTDRSSRAVDSVEVSTEFDSATRPMPTQPNFCRTDRDVGTAAEAGFGSGGERITFVLVLVIGTSLAASGRMRRR
jgi:hypothetical protein